MEKGERTSARPDLHFIITVQGLLQPVALGQLLVELCARHATVGGASWNTGSRTCESHRHRKLCFLPSAKQEEEEDIDKVSTPLPPSTTSLCNRVRLISANTPQRCHSVGGPTKAPFQTVPLLFPESTLQSTSQAPRTFTFSS